MDIKAGWKTTEFWTSVGTALTGVLVLMGYLTPSESGNILNGITQIVGGVMAIVPVVTYSISRGKAKAGTVDVEQVAQIVASLAAAKEEK